MSITFGRIVASSVVALAISLSLTVGVAPIYAQAKKASAKKSATVKCLSQKCRSCIVGSSHPQQGAGEFQTCQVVLWFLFPSIEDTAPP